MFQFNINKLYVKHVLVKSATPSMGGSIRVVDEENSTDTVERYKKISVPGNVIRTFILSHGKTSRFLKPVNAALTYYDDNAVALEPYPYNYETDIMDTVSGGLVKWKSNSERNVSNIIDLTRIGNWFTDGVLVYRFKQDDPQVDLTRNGKFRAVQTEGFCFSSISFHKTIEGSNAIGFCIQFETNSGKVVTSPPLWKKMIVDNSHQCLANQDEGKKEHNVSFVSACTMAYPFDQINETLAVNIAFALKAAEDIADIFGYDSIEPLALEEMMIGLNTVNLPRLHKHIKYTHDIGMPFTHAFAWLLGLLNKTQTLADYIVIRSLLQYLTKKGVYRKQAYTENSVYRKDKSVADVPLLSLDEETFAIQ